MTRQAWTIDEFCQAHAISRATFYNLQKRNMGPRVMHVGAKRLVSEAAAAEWRDQMERAVEQKPTGSGGHR